MNDLDRIKGIVVGAAIGAWIWAGIAFLVCLVFIG